MRAAKAMLSGNQMQAERVKTVYKDLAEGSQAAAFRKAFERAVTEPSISPERQRIPLVEHIGPQQARASIPGAEAFSDKRAADLFVDGATQYLRQNEIPGQVKEDDGACPLKFSRECVGVFSADVPAVVQVAAAEAGANAVQDAVRGPEPVIVESFDAARLDAARALLGRDLTSAEDDAIQRAHAVGEGHSYVIGLDGQPMKNPDPAQAYPTFGNSPTVFHLDRRIVELDSLREVEVCALVQGLSVNAIGSVREYLLDRMRIVFVVRLAVCDEERHRCYFTGFDLSFRERDDLA